MKEERKIHTKVVEEEQVTYIAKDGKRFLNKKECEIHEMILDGKARVCPSCNGKGETYNYEITGYTIPGMRGDAIWEKVWGKCEACEGKGYQLQYWK